MSPSHWEPPTMSQAPPGVPPACPVGPLGRVASLRAAGARPQPPATPSQAVAGGAAARPCLLSASEKLTLKRAGRALQLIVLGGV